MATKTTATKTARNVAEDLIGDSSTKRRAVAKPGRARASAGQQRGFDASKKIKILTPDRNVREDSLDGIAFKALKNGMSVETWAKAVDKTSAWKKSGRKALGLMSWFLRAKFVKLV